MTIARPRFQGGTPFGPPLRALDAAEAYRNGEIDLATAQKRAGGRQTTPQEPSSADLSAKRAERRRTVALDGLRKRLEIYAKAARR